MGQNVDKGIAAVWFGIFKTKAEFQAYIKVHYELEKNIDSEFEKDFELKYYDKSLVESKFIDEKGSDLVELLSGLSYHESFNYDFRKLLKVKYNGVIIIYDFEYIGNKMDVSNNNSIIHFYSNISYEKIVDLSWMEL